MSSQDAAINIALRFVDQAVAPYNKAMDNMVNKAVKAAAAVGISFQAIDFFKAGFDSVERFKLSVAEATAFITTFSEKSASGDLAGGFKDANDYAMRLIPALEAIDAKTIASGKDLTAMSNTMMQNGVLLDIDNQKQVQGFINIANALSLVTTGQNKDIQIRQEINALLQGQVRNTDRLPKLLAAIDPKLEEHLKLWKSQGTTIEHVGEMLGGFGASADLIEETWAAVGSSLETVRDKVLRDGFAPVYKDILGIATEIRSSLIDTEGQLTPLAIGIQTKIGAAYKSLKLGAMEVKAEILRIGFLLDKIGGTMSFLASLPSAIPAALGVKSSQERMQRMADYNIMFENRAADKDAELMRLAGQYNALDATNFVAAAKSNNSKDKYLTPAPKLTTPPVIDDKAVKEAQRLSEQWTATRRELEQEINLSGLTGLERKLQEITDKATEYHLQFDKAGGKASIDAWEAAATATARQADEMERINKELAYKAQANEDLLALEKELELAAMSKDQREIKGITDTYALLLEKSHLLTLMGRQTEEAEAVFARAIGVNMQKDLDDLDKKGMETAKELEQAFSGWASNMAGDLNDVLWGAEFTFESIGESFAKMITQMIIQMQIVKPLMESLFPVDSAGKSISGAGVSGLLGSIGNFFGGSGFSAETSFAGAAADLPYTASAAAGYDVPPGVNPVTQLHEKEMVLPADLASRVRNMTSGGSTVVVIKNYLGAPVKKEETIDSRGTRRIEVSIGEMVAAESQRQGSPMSGALRGFGVSPPIIGR